MGLEKELKYSLSKISSLGSYPLHLLAIAVFFKLGMGRIAVFLAIGFVLTYAVGIPLRILSFRKREHPEKQDQFLRNASSFPSFHSARATFLALTLALVFSFEYDMLILAAVLIVLVSASRVVNRQHYLSDAIGGIVLGAVLWAVSLYAL